MLPGLVLALVYGAASTGLGIYWEYSSLRLEAGMVLIGVALGFCAASFSWELGGKKAQRLWAAAAVISFQAATVCTMVFLFTPVELLRSTHYSEPVSVTASRLFWILLWDVVTPAVALVVGGLISVRAFSHANQRATLKGDAA